MQPEVDAVIERLARSRSWPWLRILDDARLDEPAVVDADAEAVVEPYRWLLKRLADGIRLTQAGYLPPVVVSETMAALGWETVWIGKGNREDLTLPVLELRETAQRFGLLRKHRGHLVPTVAGRRLIDDPENLWWHLADRLPAARSEPERHAGIAYLLLVAAGHPRDEALLAEAMGVLGWVDPGTHHSPSAHAAFAAARDTWAVFRRLSLLPVKQRWDDPGQPALPSGVALARAALLGRPRPSPVRAPATAGAPTKADRAVQLSVALRDITPPVWRRLVVAASMPLRELHEVIQTAMGWEGYHLHSFDIDGVLYGDVEEFQDVRLGDENTHTVGEAATSGTFAYEYDFGDSWHHDITVEQVTPSIGRPKPRVVDGARACPPEDCGGTWGYGELVEILADPARVEHADRRTWVGEQWHPDAFDVQETNDLLALYDRLTGPQ